MIKLIYSILCILFYMNAFSQKTAEEYAEESKRHYLMAGVALIFVIAVRYINKKVDKKDE